MSDNHKLMYVLQEKILLMHLTRFIILYFDIRLAPYGSKQFSICHCAVTSIISSKSTFCMSVLSCLPHDHSCSPVILPEELLDSVACAVPAYQLGMGLLRGCR